MKTKEKSIIDALEHPKWEIEGWKIKFLLSERLLNDIKKVSRSANWFEDPIIADTWVERLFVCYNSVENYYKTFKCLPELGDRLFNDESDYLIQERSINGAVKAITFTLSS